MNPFKIDSPTCISFSGGRTSAYMRWLVLQENDGLPADAIVCFCNTGDESSAYALAIISPSKNCSNRPHTRMYSGQGQMCLDLQPVFVFLRI